MKIFPLITAGIVIVVLFFAVLQRETLFAFAGRGADPAAKDTVANAPAAAPTAIAQDTDTDADRIGVMARASVAQAVENAILLRGQTEAARDVTVRAETGGTVISEPLRKGATIAAGTALCRLDPGTRGATLAESEARLDEARARIPEAAARVTEAEARMREAEINQTAASRLSEGGFASATRVAGADATLSSAQAALSTAKSGLESAQAGIRGAEASVDRARDDMKKLEIRAPFAGLLESDTAELGSFLQPGDPCATVIQLDPIKLVGFVPETQLGLVHVGAEAGARLASGAQAQGRVTFLARSADEMTRTFRVEVEVPNTDLALSDGQTAEILIAGGGTRAHLLPASALTLDDRGVLGVRIIDAERTAQFAPVTVLRDTVDGVWLTGLPETVDVILVGQEYVIDGVPVAPSFEELGQ
jgi:multidrug efflux system membrane fusion protein